MQHEWSQIIGWALARQPPAKTAAIAASGLTPLDYMLSVLRDESASPADRLQAAKAAAPYVHPRLAPAEASDADDDRDEWGPEFVSKRIQEKLDAMRSMMPKEDIGPSA